MFWCISYHLDAFGTIRLPYETRGKTGRTWKSSCHEVASEFFATNPLDPLHCSLNSCFGAFRTVWVFLRPFGCLTKLGAKRSELVQKFVPRTRVGIFRNESTPWDPKLMFCAFRTIWIHLGPLGCLTKLRAKWAELVQKIVPRSRVGFFSRQTHPIHPIGP